MPIETLTPTVRMVKFQPKRTFGVEMEWSTDASRAKMKTAIMTFPEEVAVICGYQRNPEADKWYCKTDSSCGHEVASRVLGSFDSIRKTLEDLKLLAEVHAKLVSIGCQVTNTCGGHVTVSLGDMDNNMVTKVMKYWVKFEKFTFEMLPTRRARNSYCHNHSGSFHSNQVYDLENIRPYFSGRNSFNIGHFSWDSSRSVHRLVEIRCGEGTQDPRCQKNWVRYILHWLESVKTMPEPTDLNWVSLREGLRLMNLLPRKGGEEVVILSPALSELREWMLARVASYANFRNGREQRARAKRIQEQLYPTPYGE